jgi:hypothetical protein
VANSSEVHAQVAADGAPGQAAQRRPGQRRQAEAHRQQGRGEAEFAPLRKERRQADAQPQEQQQPHGERFGIEAAVPGAGQIDAAPPAQQMDGQQHQAHQPQHAQQARHDKPAEDHEEQSLRGADQGRSFRLLGSFGRRQRQPPEPAQALHQLAALGAGYGGGEPIAAAVVAE